MSKNAVTQEPVPAFYLDASDWGSIRAPLTPHRIVQAYRHGFYHGGIKLIPFYAAPVAAAPAVVAVRVEGIGTAHLHLVDGGIDLPALTVLSMARHLCTLAAPGIDLNQLQRYEPDKENKTCGWMFGMKEDVTGCWVHIEDLRTMIDASPKGGITDAKNAARYRWLRDESGNAASDTPTTIVQDNEGGFDFVFGEALDSAIDAAMQATSAEVGECNCANGRAECMPDCASRKPTSHGAGVSDAT